jgi:hypothetical protein
MDKHNGVMNRIPDGMDVNNSTPIYQELLESGRENGL